MYSQSFLDLLRQDFGADVFISTHKFCDGDGLGAGLALCRGLKKIGKTPRFITLEEPHPKYRFMDKQKDIHIFNEDKTKIPKNSVFIFVDVNDIKLVQPLYSFIKKKQAQVYFIDHHPLIESKTTLSDCFFIDTQSSSTAELIYILLKKLNIPIDEQIAVCLFSSIVFDTNLFRDIKNSPRPFALAAKLVPKIPNVNVVYENLFKHLTTSKLSFMARLKDTEYYLNNKLAILCLKEEDFKKHNTDSTQAYDLIDIIRNVDTVESIILIIENNSGGFKLSMRSAKTNLLPLARAFGGGGHSHSAGAFVNNISLKEVKNKVTAFFMSSIKEGQKINK